jgi:CHAT domain-containing protein/Tfp pilus assembly protein PilF
MLCAKIGQSLLVAAAIYFASLSLAQSAPNLAVGQTEEAALRAVVEKFFAAYGKKDLAGLAALWSEKSAELAAFKQTAQQQFAAEDYSFSAPAISRIRIEKEKASLQAVFDLTATNLRSKQKRETRVAQIFVFVKGSGEWKIERYLPAVNYVAEALIKAKTEAERERLLVEEKDFATPELVRAISLQGVRLNNSGKFQDALDAFGLAQSIAVRINDKVGVGRTHLGLGNVYNLHGKNFEAIAHYQKSLEISQELGDKDGAFRSLGSIGNVHKDQGRYTQALEYYEQCLAVLEALKNEAGVAVVLHNTGLVYYLQGNYVQALDTFNKSRTILTKIDDKVGIASVLGDMGNVYYQRGAYAQALEHHQKSLKALEASDNKVRVARTLNNIGVIHSSQGNYEQALDYHQRSLAMKQAFGDDAGIASSLNSIGNVYSQWGNNEKALKFFQESLAIRQRIGDNAGVAFTLNNIGETYSRMGDYSPALEYFQRSLDASKTLGDQDGIATALHNIGSLHNAVGDLRKEQAHYRQAMDFAERASELARQIGSIDTLWQARLAVGLAHRGLNQHGQALLAFEDSIKNIEILRAQVAGGEQETRRFFETKLSPYHGSIDLFIDQNRVGEAFVYAERAKARVLLDALQSGRVNITKTMAEMEQEQERRLNYRLVSLNTQIFRENQREKPDKPRLEALERDLQKARLEYEAFETSLYAAHPELKVRRGETQMLTLEEVGPLLPDAKTAVLKFVVAEEKCSLFVLTKNAPGNQAAVEVKVFPIAIKQKDLTERVAQFRNQVAERDQTFAKNATALFQFLLAPARPLLQGKTTLIIVPDGPLWELPFQALQSPESRYLLQDYAVFYAPSLTVLREMVKLRRQTRAPAANPTLLAVGNPALGQQTVKLVHDATMGEKLVPLPAAQRQAEELGKLYGQQRSKVYTGAEATEERVKAESAGYNILHLAAHGALNNRSPMYSHIVLSQLDEKGKEDGLLEAWELMKLDLKADLAVLSACETARGRVVGGEGVIGLTWALFVAGCPTTVVSQWKVNDQSTADLMVEFHRRLRTRSASLDSRNSIAQALRQAALKLLGKSQYQHPYYWAGFIVVGDGY